MKYSARIFVCVVAVFIADSVNDIAGLAALFALLGIVEIVSARSTNKGGCL
jgi:hypothetical protein